MGESLLHKTLELVSYDRAMAGSGKMSWPGFSDIGRFWVFYYAQDSGKTRAQMEKVWAAKINPPPAPMLY